jgi:hypothetical protein
LEATHAAPALFAKLKATLASNNTPIDQLASQAFEFQQAFRGDENHAVHVLDTDKIGFRLYVNAEVTANIRKRPALRLPPRPVDLPIHKALGRLRRSVVQYPHHDVGVGVNVQSQLDRLMLPESLARRRRGWRIAFSLRILSPDRAAGMRMQGDCGG